MFKNVPKEKISAKKKLYENSKIVKMKIRWQYFVQYFFFSEDKCFTNISEQTEITAAACCYESSESDFSAKGNDLIGFNLSLKLYVKKKKQKLKNLNGM